MPSKIALAAEVLPPGTRQEVGRLVPKQTLTALRFVKKLRPNEQNFLVEEDRQVVAARLTQGMAGLAFGCHLSNIHTFLTKVAKAAGGKQKRSGLFYKYLRHRQIAPKTAYRYISGFENAKNLLPEQVVKAAMARGIQIITTSEDRPLGAFTESVRYLPPPRNPDPDHANKYLDELVSYTKERKKRLAKKGATPTAREMAEIEKDPKVLLISGYRSLSRLVRHLSTPRAKRNWLEHVVGMIMTEIGLQSAQSFSPSAVPPEFQAKRGRPVTKPKEEKPAA